MERKQEGGEAKKTLVEFLRFNVVGVLNTLVDFVVFWALNTFAGWTYAAQVISYTCGLVNSYLWNSSWTFREKKTRSAGEIGRFVAVNLASLLVSLLLLYVCRSVLRIDDAWVASWIPEALSGVVKGDTVCKLLTTPAVVVVNYIGNRLFVFRKEPTGE